MILGGWPPSKSNFLGALFLADFAWWPAAKDHFLGGFGIFLGGIWLARQLRFGVVDPTPLERTDVSNCLVLMSGAWSC